MNKVLLIDDDQDYTFLMELFFKSNSRVGRYQISNSVPSAVQFLETCEIRDFPEIIFLDLHLPEHDGFNFLRSYGEKVAKKGCAIYILTSSFTVTDREKALSFEGVRDVLVKPLTRETLQSILN